MLMQLGPTAQSHVPRLPPLGWEKGIKEQLGGLLQLKLGGRCEHLV